MNSLVCIVIAGVVVVCSPVAVFIVVKMATLGYLYGRRAFERDQLKERKHHGR